MSCEDSVHWRHYVTCSGKSHPASAYRRLLKQRSYPDSEYRKTPDAVAEESTIIDTRSRLRFIRTEPTSNAALFSFA